MKSAGAIGAGLPVGGLVKLAARASISGVTGGREILERAPRERKGRWSILVGP